MSPRPQRPGQRPRPGVRPRHRGVTLIEMLVAVALLVLMMTVIVQVFTAATGAASAQRTFQELDGVLRQLDSTLRTDLANVTARFTPPLDPDKNLGYFEYGENSHPDIQGEDCDDYIRFTTKAPEGQLFVGRFYAPPTAGLATPPGVTGKTTMTAAQFAEYLRSQPMAIASQYAEVIYFLRNGNLYRRVLLVAPDRQSAVINQFLATGGSATTNGKFTTGAFGTGISVSWQGVNDLSARPLATGNPFVIFPGIILNTLGDLTNRENRFAYMRWANDFFDESTGTSPPDGIPDDLNLDTVPDQWPSLYAGLFNGSSKPAAGVSLVNDMRAYWPKNGGTDPRSAATIDTMAFPYVYPGAYSVADPSTSAAGPIHTPDPSIDQTNVADLRIMNHNPLDLGGGDSLPTPGNGSKATSPPTFQTWWGFPTWRETMNANWNDPYTMANSGGQPNGLSFLTPILLPPMTSVYRLTPQLFTDGSGSTSFYTAALWAQCWEDDLIATGVRSFDVKAYDDSYPGYVDLGWGDDLRDPVASTAGIAGTYLTATPAATPTTVGTFSTYGQTMAHEGRIPPLTTDGRPDSQWPAYNTNVGDDGTGIIRLRRVWDTWSTTYARAWSKGVNSNPGTAMAPNLNYGMRLGPPFGPPVYPSYSAPYPAPLRGIQIQIRVVDPRGERLKTLTLRQDFSDKL